MAINELKRVRRPDPDTVICPACAHDFEAISVNVQAELSRLRAENEAKDAEIERLKAILADALEWGMTSKHFDAGRSLKNGEDARAALSRAEPPKPEPATCVWTWCCFGNWHTFCGNDWGGVDRPDICPCCGKRIEVAGKAEGRQE